MFSLLYILSAALGLGFLIFIHELGHYLVAKRVGMRVEVFSIGFGKPIYSWKVDGVTWQICYLPFGGYVKMAGMEPVNGKEPSDIPDGFWGRSPWDRIKVALAGPLVNLVFALLVFGMMWLAGGREKPFAEFTHRVGWVDPASELYAEGLRPGDTIISYDGRELSDYKDHLYAAMLSDSQVDVKGLRFDPQTGDPTPFVQTIKTYQHPDSLEKGIMTTGVMNSASYLMYDRLSNGQENPLSEGSPMQNSGLEYGDRVVWVDGVTVQSLRHLGQVLNDERALITVERAGKSVLARVPRVHLKELRLDDEHREEITDWQFASSKTSTAFGNLFFIPYNLDATGVIENRIAFIDSDREDVHFPEHLMSPADDTLFIGDRILAIDGVPVSRSYQVLSRLQERSVHVVVERNSELQHQVSWDKADTDFAKNWDVDSLNSIARSLGSGAVVHSAGDYVLLKPVQLRTRAELMAFGKDEEALEKMEQAQAKAISQIEDPVKRAQVLALLKKQDTQYLLGIPGVQDRTVRFNPPPHVQFNMVFQETWRTLEALVTGYLSPKWVSGPVGIVQVIHHGWSVGLVEVLFWLGVISLNLGVMNLLPIPVLDGGYIVLSLFEILSGKRLKARHVERVILPFAILLISLFLFLTFNDLSRLLGGFFH